MGKIKKVLLVLSLFVMGSFNANAKDYSLKDIEDYLSSLKSFSAKFDQIVPGEEFSKGELFIKKPGKFLWQYKTPENVKIVSNGGFVYFIDKKQGQTTQLPPSGIMFSMLSKKQFSFSRKGLTVKSFKQTKNRVSLIIVAKVEDAEIPLGMVFEKLKDGKLELVRITSLNQLSQTIVINLYEHNHNAQINKNIFKVDIEEDEF